MLPPLLNRLAAACPEADVVLTESTSPEALERLVETGRLDLSFAVQPFAQAGVDARRAVRGRAFCLLVPRAHELAGRGFPVGLDELARARSCPPVRARTCIVSGSPPS